MISKKLILPFLLLSILSTTIANAVQSPAGIITKAGATIAGGLAAGAVVGNYMPGPLAAKIVAGAATTALVTPGILLYQNLHRLSKSVEKYTALTHFYLSPLAAPILGITAGSMIAKSLQTNLPTQIAAGSAIATGITAAALGLWTLITVPGAMKGGTGKG